MAECTKTYQCPCPDPDCHRRTPVKYNVMVKCLTGTWTLFHDPLRWERNVHTITWTTCSTYEEALRTMQELRDGDPVFKNLMSIWTENVS